MPRIKWAALQILTFKKFTRHSLSLRRIMLTFGEYSMYITIKSALCTEKTFLSVQFYQPKMYYLDHTTYLFYFRHSTRI